MLILQLLHQGTQMPLNPKYVCFKIGRDHQKKQTPLRSLDNNSGKEWMMAELK